MRDIFMTKPDFEKYLHDDTYKLFDAYWEAPFVGKSVMSPICVWKKMFTYIHNHLREDLLHV